MVALQQRLEGAPLDEQVAAADVVLDCSDNFATRHAINRACVRHRKPLVSGAAIKFDGQVSVFDLRQPASPCYHCLFPEGQEVEEVRCAVMGVFAPLTGIIGTVQAAEALKLLIGCGESLCRTDCCCWTGWPWTGARSRWPGIRDVPSAAQRDRTRPAIADRQPSAKRATIRRSSPTWRTSRHDNERFSSRLTSCGRSNMPRAASPIRLGAR